MLDRVDRYHRIARVDIVDHVHREHAEVEQLDFIGNVEPLEHHIVGGRSHSIVEVQPVTNAKYRDFSHEKPS